MSFKSSTAGISGSITSSANNFDLIRLFAATQVALYHAIAHLKVDGPWSEILHVFPGVPIFFFISGFLIYQSWENIKSDKTTIFVTNRVLRLFPALYVCFALSVASIVVNGYLSTADLTSPNFVKWAVAQLTMGQFYNPDFLRGYGNGVLNGSLGTISVELQFYILTPVLYFILRRSTGAFFLLAAALAVLNIVNSQINDREAMAGKLFAVSFIPWVWMFMVGAYLSTNKILQKTIIKTGWVTLLGIYLPLHALSLYLDLGVGNSIHPLSFLILSCIVLKAAYTYPTLSNKILKRNDVSYGVYIYHMPIVNFFLHNGLVGWAYCGISIMLSFVFAAISWSVIEKPALKLKKVALRTNP